MINIVEEKRVKLFGNFQRRLMVVDLKWYRVGSLQEENLDDFRDNGKKKMTSNETKRTIWRIEMSLIIDYDNLFTIKHKGLDRN